MTVGTTFNIASISKVFATSAIAVLLDQGKISSLDDDICNAIPASWKRSACRNPNFPNAKVTWRMFATHRTSLIANIPSVNSTDGAVSASYGPQGGYLGAADGNPTCPLTDVQGFYRDYLTQKPTETAVGATTVLDNGERINWYNVGEENGGAWQNFQPGSKSDYSNFAMGYIAALVELVSGQPFAAFCKQHMFEPLGMTNTAWFLRDLPPETRNVIPVDFFQGRYEDIGPYCYIDYASGQFHTTPTDMAKWATAMLNMGAPMLWSDAVGQQVFSCQERDAQGNEVEDCDYRLGWDLLDNSLKPFADSTMNSLKKYDWTNGVAHAGEESGVLTQLVVLPEANVYISVFSNTNGFDDSTPQKIMSMLADLPIPADSLPAPDTASPTATPSTTTTAVETPPGICFSGHTTVDVLGKGTIMMNNLEVGDHVRVGDNIYERVYSFGHRSVDRKAEFLQILPSKLELSKEHMIFIEGKTFPIPASMLMVGDVLSNGKTVQAIRMVTRIGVFNPYTPSGKVLVNGVAASNYISLQNSDVLMVGGIKLPFLSHHMLDHAFQTPHRIWCHWMGRKDDTFLSSNNGFSGWSEPPFRFSQWMLQQHAVLLTLLLFPFLAMLILFVAVEAMLLHPLVPIVLVASTVFLYAKPTATVVKN